MLGRFSACDTLAAVWHGFLPQQAACILHASFVMATGFHRITVLTNLHFNRVFHACILSRLNFTGVTRSAWSCARMVTHYQFSCYATTWTATCAAPQAARISEVVMGHFFELFFCQCELVADLMGVALHVCKVLMPLKALLHYSRCMTLWQEACNCGESPCREACNCGESPCPEACNCGESPCPAGSKRMLVGICR